MRKVTLIISSILVLLTALLALNMSGIYGYFHDEETITEELVFGSIETEIVEECDTKPVMPGEEFKKIVQVKNTGNNPCFVRVKVLISPEEYTDELALDINTNDWKYKDGFYYYRKVLNVNDETTPIFTKLHIPNNLEKGDTFDINIYSESIQSVIYENDNTTTKDFLEIFEKI